MSTSITLQSAVHARNFFDQALAEMAPGFQDGKKFQCTLQPETRSNADNAHFHALIGQIAAQTLIGGVQMGAGDAKRVLISAFKIDTKDDMQLARHWAKMGELRMAVGLRGEVVALGEQSRKFPAPLAKAFIHWLNAYGAEAGVKFMAPKSWQDPSAQAHYTEET